MEFNPALIQALLRMADVMPQSNSMAAMARKPVEPDTMLQMRGEPVTRENPAEGTPHPTWPGYRWSRTQKKYVKVAT